MIVYRHRRLDTHEVFYVGIGKDEKRAHSKHNRNRYWHNAVNKVGYVVEILTEVETWKEACELEMLLISEYGRRDQGKGNLVNMTDGGEGTVGAIMSELAKQKMSEYRKGRRHNLGKKHTEATKQKISNKNKGRKLSKETKKRVSEATKGTKNPRVKLTEIQVLEIKYSNFKMSYREIGVMYGIDKTTVYDIKNNRSWKHL